jgi:hypothetical protein
MNSEESIAFAKRWFNFVKSLNEREPKTVKIERKPSGTLNDSAPQRSRTRVSILMCKYCGSAFSTISRPSCPRFNGSCFGATEDPSAIVVAVYCRWCGDMFTMTNRPKCRVMYNTYCHTRSEPLP